MLIKLNVIADTVKWFHWKNLPVIKILDFRSKCTLLISQWILSKTLVNLHLQHEAFGIYFFYNNNATKLLQMAPVLCPLIVLC